MASDKIIELSSDNFEQETKANPPILVDFWAEWCGPCRMVAPVLEELAEEMGGRVRIGKLNVDNNQEISSSFQVSSIPTFLLFQDGEVKDRIMGAMPKRAFESFLERNLPAAPASAATA